MHNEFADVASGLKFVKIGDSKVKILSAEDSAIHLGRHLSLVDTREKEVEFRIAAGWKSFFARKEEHCNKAYPLQDRIRLFEATITKCVLYGS